MIELEPAELAAAGQNGTPPPDTINPQSPSETPPFAPPAEDPLLEPPGIEAPREPRNPAAPIPEIPPGEA